MTYLLFIGLIACLAFLWQLHEKHASSIAAITQLGQRLSGLQIELDKFKIYSENMNSHQGLTSRSIITHLHASGLIFSTRISDTYDMLATESQGDSERPSYMPMLNNPFSLMSSVDESEYKEWRDCNTSETYHYHFRMRIPSEESENYFE